MRISEALEQIKRYEQELIGKKIGDAGHKIEGFGLSLISENNYEVFVLGQDLRSYVNFVRKPLNDWLEANNY